MRSLIFFGAVVFLLSIIWLGVGQDAYYDHYCASADQKTADEVLFCKSQARFERALHRNPTAYFTKWLVVFTAVLSGVSIIQIFFLIRSDATARIAANVAAEALRNLERPAVFVEATFARVGYGGVPHVEYKISNYGRATAIIRSRRVMALIRDEIPDSPPHHDGNAGEQDWTALPCNGVIAQLYENLVPIADRSDINGGTKKLIFCGRLTYEDAFGKVYFTDFGSIFEPQDRRNPHIDERFVACDKAGYNERN